MRRDLRREVLAISDALPVLHPDEAESEPLVVSFMRGRQEVRWTFSPADLLLFAAATNPLSGLPEDARAILGLLVKHGAESNEPLNGKEIAAGLRIDYGPAMRKHLAPDAPLRARGLVDHVGRNDGYHATDLAMRVVPREE